MASLRTLFVLIVLVAPVARAADPAGTWRAEFTGPGGTKGAETLALVVKDKTVSGTLENAVGGVGPLRDGTWDGRTIRFWVAWGPSDRLEAVGQYGGGPALQLDFKTSQWRAIRVFKRVDERK